VEALRKGGRGPLVGSVGHEDDFKVAGGLAKGRVHAKEAVAWWGERDLPWCIGGKRGDAWLCEPFAKGMVRSTGNKYGCACGKSCGVC
jgi:hypothetical protein